MPTFNTQVIRMASDTTSKESSLDLNTSAEPQAWWARSLSIQVGLFYGPDQAVLLDVSDIQSVSVYLKDPGNLDGGALVTKTITSFDNTTTIETWQAGTQQHFVVAFTPDDLSFSLTNGARLVHLSMVAVTTGGATATVCVSTLNLIDDGGNSPESNPVNAITVTQAQAMVAVLAWTASAIALGAAGNTSVGYTQTWLLGRQPIALSAGAGAYVANLVLGDANALPGALLRIPIDFPASANPTINIYDSSTSGSLLATVTNPNPSAIASFLFTAGFDGAAWHKESGAWQ